MRAWAALALLGTCASCSSADKASPSVAAGDETIACALNGATEMREVCTVERVQKGDAMQLVVHHPDGGFRRFDIRTDGTGLAPADGADDVRRRVEGHMLELAVGGDTYRFPATIESHDKTP